MKAFNKLFSVVIAAIIVLFVIANMILMADDADSGRKYRVEINRLALKIEANSFEITDLGNCQYVTGITKYGEDFYNVDSDYVIREINGELYRFDYKEESSTDKTKSGFL